jgi:hypothetical protein
MTLEEAIAERRRRREAEAKQNGSSNVIALDGYLNAGPYEMTKAGLFFIQVKRKRRMTTTARTQRKFRKS